MPDRVDAAADAVQPAALEPVVDRPRADAELDQLPPRHDAMLPRGQVRDRSMQDFRPVASSTPHASATARMVACRSARQGYVRDDSAGA